MKTTTEIGSAEFWQRLHDEPGRLAAEICFIDVARLDEMLQRHPSLRAWVNSAHEVARVEEDRSKRELTKARARALLAAKAENDPNTNKGKTVAVLDAEVEQDKDVLDAMEAYLQVSEKRAALRAMADALDDRKDMLIQIAAKRRKEMEDYQ